MQLMLMTGLVGIQLGERERHLQARPDVRYPGATPEPGKLAPRPAIQSWWFGQRWTACVEHNRVVSIQGYRLELDGQPLVFRDQ